MVFTVRTLYKECTHRILLHMFAYDPMNLDIFSHSTRDVEAATALRPWAPIFPLAVNWTSLFVARAFLPQHNTRKLNHSLHRIATCCPTCCKMLQASSSASVQGFPPSASAWARQLVQLAQLAIEDAAFKAPCCFRHDFALADAGAISAGHRT